jgi:propionyl-CoA synthetase
MIRIVHRIRIVNKKYLSTQSKSYQDTLQFWNKAASDIKWIRQSDRILDIKDPIFPKWFPNGMLSTCYNAVDRHVEEGFGSSQAIIFDSPVTNTIRKLTYSDLLKNVQSLSALFIEKGIKKGDRVLIYMPNIPETVITMLACARIGAIHSVVFGGYAPSEIATRIKDSKPSIIVCTSCGIEGSKVVPYKSFVDTAIAMVNNEHEVKQVLVLRRTQLQDPPMTKGRDFDWDDSIKPFADAKVECEPMMSSDPSYILYTSGTTGAPKGVVRDTGIIII